MSILVFISKYVKEILISFTSLLAYFLYKKNTELKQEKESLEKVIDEATSIVTLQKELLKNIKNAKNTAPSHVNTIKLMQDEKL